MSISMKEPIHLPMGREAHWQSVYLRRDEHDLSWFEPEPLLSLGLIVDHASNPSSKIVDVGGGTSRLVDLLVAKGYCHLTIVDIAAQSLALSRKRLGQMATKVEWVTSDILQWEPKQTFDVWHDRATYHFLTDPEDRAQYTVVAANALHRGATLVLHTFAIDGPSTCSGLPVFRPDKKSIAEQFINGFRLQETVRYCHTTPTGTTQNFEIFVLGRT